MSATTEVAFETEREYEVFDGKLEEKEVAGGRHGGVTARLIGKLVTHVEDNFLGGIYTPDTTFLIGAQERLPDIGFVTAARLPEEGEPTGIWTIAPDLAIEVISPNDLWARVTRKVQDYFAAGVREVWLVAPEFETVTIYRSPVSSLMLMEDEELSSEELLPGFRCRVGEIFQPSVRRRPTP